MSQIPFQNIGSAVVYDLEQQQTLDSLIESAKEEEKKSRKSTHYFQLVDDLSLPNVVTNLAFSPCFSYLYIGGSYPPQVKIFDLENFSEKVSQHTQDHILSIQPLPIDPPISKVAILYDSRYIEFYHQHAKYHRIRVPFLARKILYSPPHCDLYVGGSNTNLFRFNLELGQFLPSVSLTNSQDREQVVDILCGSRNKIHQLLAFGCEDGSVKFVDPRKKTLCASFLAIQHINRGLGQNSGQPQSSTFSQANNINRHHNYLTSIQEQPQSVENVEYDNDGVTFAVGSDKGQIGLFDLRKNGLIYLKSHHHDSKITSIRFTDHQKKYIVSSDRYTIKIWQRDQPSSQNITNIQPRGKINDVAVYPESGMIFVGQDREKVTPYYIPALGPSPYWCSFLDHFVGSLRSSGQGKKDGMDDEEEEVLGFRKTVLYRDMETKFVSVKEVKRLGMEGFVGTSLLKSDLHGWRINRNVYERISGMRDITARKKEIQRMIVKDKFNAEMGESRFSEKPPKKSYQQQKKKKKKKRRRDEEGEDEVNRGNWKKRKI